MSGAPECRLLVDPPSSGAWNMAVDEALLIAASRDNVATLRFYEWEEPTLSLGYFQRHEDRTQHAGSRQCPVVRRQSGGGAILHDRELTYSLTLPARHPLAQRSPQLYTAVHEAILRLLKRLLPASGASRMISIFCPALPQIVSKNQHATREPFLCFKRRAPGDVILTPQPASADPSQTAENWKIVGSAQRRHRGAILQHGSVLLARSPAAPELPGYCDLTEAAITASTLASDLSTEISRILCAPVESESLPASLCVAARQIAREKYGADSWTHRR
jgi:lipoyl(octanoyl) transferase